MKVLVIGASGHVGSAAVEALSKKHDVIAVTRNTDPSVDITDSDSLKSLFEQVGEVDAVVSAYGVTPFKQLGKLTSDDYQSAFDNKVQCQINLVRVGLDYVRDGGSFTLTSGILAREAIRTGAAAAMANGAIESWVLTAAGELPRGIRINTVSPTVLEDAPGYHDAFPGFEPVSSHTVGLAYVRAVDGLATGSVITA